MGRTSLFECSRCGYRASVAGGTAEGAEFSVQTILCTHCRELYDAVISLKVPWRSPLIEAGSGLKLAERTKTAKAAPTFDSALNRLPLTGRMRTRWQKFKPACPVSAFHRVRAWNQPDKCPRCGAFMESNALPFRQWD